MILFRRLSQISTRRDRDDFAAVIKLYQDSFAYSPEYAGKIAKLLKPDPKRDFEVVLLLAKGAKSRVLGFSLSFYFSDVGCGYLDYLVSDPSRKQRGIGSALYEITREHFVSRKCWGLFLDVPPDDREKLKEPFRLKVNRKRLAFYEKYNARPIIHTLYDCLPTPANQGHPTLLIFDDLGSSKPLRRRPLKKAVARFLLVKGNMTREDPRTREILDSITDDPIQLRPLVYSGPVQDSHQVLNLTKIHVVNVGDGHQIHHLKERGYVERPARMDALLKGMRELSVEFHKVKAFPNEPIREVHDAGLLNFLSKAPQRLAPGKLLYPNVFPIRKPKRLPKSWEMQGGFYCIDTFTPLTANSYRAARHAVNGALTGAQLLIQGQHRVYVLCRPPGHHAESRVFGGFCYLNNAAIAANFLSKEGPVAVLDIDYHHGNGTQNIFYKRNDVYFISIHGHPVQAYPYFAGYSEEKGSEQGLGFNRNYPLKPGTGDEHYLKTLSEACGVIRKFKPEFLVISLGYDIMKGDPTGTFLVTPTGMMRIGDMLGKLNLPTLLVQEGGYSLPNLKVGCKNFLTGFCRA